MKGNEPSNVTAQSLYNIFKKVFPKRLVPSLMRVGACIHLWSSRVLCNIQELAPKGAVGADVEDVLHKTDRLKVGDIRGLVSVIMKDIIDGL